MHVGACKPIKLSGGFVIFFYHFSSSKWSTYSCVEVSDFCGLRCFVTLKCFVLWIKLCTGCPWGDPGVLLPSTGQMGKLRQIYFYPAASPSPMIWRCQPSWAPRCHSSLLEGSGQEDGRRWNDGGGQEDGSGWGREPRAFLVCWLHATSDITVLLIDKYIQNNANTVS